MRTPDDSGRFEYGVRLRLADGPMLRNDDQLLHMYGASIESFSGFDSDIAQDDRFSPGRAVRLETEFDEDGDSVVGVWDASGVARAGTFDYALACPMVAALDHGLDLRGLVLSEFVAASGGRRVGLDVLVFSPALIRVDVPDQLVLDRPVREAQRRIVLLADGESPVGFWDPSGSAGPASPNDLPLSSTLAEALGGLRAGYEQLAQQGGEADDVAEQLEAQWARNALDHKASVLWRRARRELGRKYAVGFQGPGMATPVWSPYELSADDEPDADVDWS